MLFRDRFLEGIRNGTISLAYRRWTRPSVKAGGTLLTPIGELDALLDRLRRLDARAAEGAWSRQTLEVIERRPAVRAGDICLELGQERMPFKLNVRKLKALGLTESLDIGYRLSARGAAVLGALRARPTSP